MDLYKASPSDVVDQPGKGTSTRDNDWVSLQLAPSRVLYVENARELVRLLLNCKKAHAYRVQVGGLNKDKWFKRIQKAQSTDFRFLYEPPAPPMVGVFINPNEIERFANMMADDLSKKISGIGGNRDAIKDRIAYWFTRNGGESAWCLAADVFRSLYRETPTSEGWDNAARVRDELFGVVHLMWQRNDAYKRFIERQAAEYEKGLRPLSPAEQKHR